MNIDHFQNSPAGKLLRIGEGEAAYWAFAPHPLPPALDADWELVGQLPETNRADAALWVTDVELDFIINYDIKYRMGKEGEDDKGIPLRK